MAGLPIKPYLLLIAGALLVVAFFFPDYLEEVRLESQANGSFTNGWPSVFGLALALALRPVEGSLADTKAPIASQPLIETLIGFAAGRKVMLLTSRLQEGSPSLAGRRPGQAMLPGAVKLADGTVRDRACASALRQILIGPILRDRRPYMPDVIAVDRNVDKQALLAGFDMLASFLSDPAFRKEWGEYRLVTQAPTGISTSATAGPSPSGLWKTPLPVSRKHGCHRHLALLYRPHVPVAQPDRAAVS